MVNTEACTVYLSYRYSNEMDSATKEVVKNSVKFVEETLVKFGCCVFDEHRDGFVSTCKILIKCSSSI